MKHYPDLDEKKAKAIAEIRTQNKFNEDYKGKLLIPGLINAHGHAAMTLLRGLGRGRKLQDWLFNVIFPIEDKWIEMIFLEIHLY